MKRQLSVAYFTQHLRCRVTTLLISQHTPRCRATVSRSSKTVVIVLLHNLQTYGGEGTLLLSTTPPVEKKIERSTLYIYSFVFFIPRGGLSRISDHLPPRRGKKKRRRHPFHFPCSFFLFHGGGCLESRTTSPPAVEKKKSSRFARRIFYFFFLQGTGTCTADLHPPCLWKKKT